MIKKICHKLHLWLGLITGLIVFIVAVTGCIYAFEPEIRHFTEPYQFVEIQNKPFLSPSELKQKAMPYVYESSADTTNSIYGVTYGQATHAVRVAYNHHSEGYSILLMNPYTGEYIHKKVFKSDFFRFVLSGHRNLWLPYAVGHQIVGWSMVLFLVLIVTGIVLRLPKKFSKKSLKQIFFKIRWRSKFTKLNYDLHNIFGIYAAVFSLIFVLTGLTWSFSWYNDTYYKVISGGKDLKAWRGAVSDTTSISSPEDLCEKLWIQSNQEYPIGQQGSFMFDFPSGNKGTYCICFNPSDDTFYQRHYRFFDQYTLQEVEGGGVYGISPKLSTRADKFYRMTYDIHVGAIGGILGRILVFMASLAIATLPITGFIIWWKKRRKKTNSGR